MLSSREQRPVSNPPASARKSNADHRLRVQMVEVERRQWRLWVSAIAVTVPLTLGIMSFALPYLLGPVQPIDALNLDLAVRGLLAMVLLFDLYSIYQQVQIVRIRRQLRNSERLFDLIGENAADLIAVVDVKGNRIYNSPSYEKILGYTAEDLAGSSGLDQVHPDDREKVIAANNDAKEDGIGRRLEYRMRHKNGSWRVLESTASAVRNDRGEIERLVIVNRDITERKQAEEELKESEHQLRQAQKMEAVGRLSGGIAHDFNNLLSVIIGYADELDPSRDDTEKLRKNAEQIKKAGLRAASLTRQLLAFSRQQVLQPKILELNGVVADLAKMLKRLIGADIELTLTLDPAAGRVKADPEPARSGHRESGGQRARRHARRRQADDRNHQRRAERHNRPPRCTTCQPGSYVQLTVTDTGTGMDAETLAHIFEPFFTTKEKGKGTGLGSFHRVRHRQTERRLHLGGQRTGQGHVLQDFSAAGNGDGVPVRQRQIETAPPRQLCFEHRAGGGGRRFAAGLDFGVAGAQWLPRADRVERRHKRWRPLARPRPDPSVADRRRAPRNRRPAAGQTAVRRATRA